MTTYPMQVVVRETGLSAHVLRVWEKRYGAVQPARAENQRRVYGAAEVARLKLLRQVTQRGHPIGSVAGKTDEQLREMVASPAPLAEWSSVNAQEAVQASLAAVRDYDSPRLARILAESARSYGYTGLLRHLVAPLAQQLGEQWQAGMLTAAHEHFATNLIRDFLLQPAREYTPSRKTATLVAATPQGQLHELGAVMAAALAATQGWETIYLGPSLPAAEIAGVAVQKRALVVALSIVYPPDDPHLVSEIATLRGLLPAEIPVFVGGQAAECYPAALEQAGVRLVTDFDQLQRELRRLRMNQMQPEMRENLLGSE